MLSKALAHVATNTAKRILEESAVEPKWLKAMSPEAKRAYFKEHKFSKYNPARPTREPSLGEHERHAIRAENNLKKHEVRITKDIDEGRKEIRKAIIKGAGDAYKHHYKEVRKFDMLPRSKSKKTNAADQMPKENKGKETPKNSTLNPNKKIYTK